MRTFHRVWIGVLLLAGSASVGAVTSGWVNSEGCFCGVLSTAQTPFVVKGAGSAGEQAAALEQLNYWNRYAAVFSPSLGTGSALPNNGINEVDVRVSAATAQANYNYIFSPYTYGVTIQSPAASAGTFNECQTFVATGCALVTEVDVLVNGDFPDGWSIDPRNYDNALLQTTVLHELGHAWGGHHVFTLPASPNAFSSLNYLKDDAGRFVTRMDANTLRAAYPTQAVGLLDVGIFPFVYGNGQYAERYTTVTPTVLDPGATLTISNFLVQNIGNQAAGLTRVQFYLSSDTQIEPGDIYLGEKQYTTFPVNSEDAASIALILPSVPPGIYYVGAVVTVDGVADGVTENNQFLIGRPAYAQLKIGLNQVADPGFELGASNPSWSEYSLRYTTPICSEADCGVNMFGLGPREQSNWVWFGDSWNVEEAFVKQSVVIPAGGPVSLEFYLAIPEGDTTGYLRVLLDGTELYRVTQADMPTFNWYKKVSLDLSDYADGGSHLLHFDSRTEAGGIDGLSFFLDDVNILAYTAGARCYAGGVTLSNTLYRRGVTRYDSSVSVDTERYVDLSATSGLELHAPTITLRDGFTVPAGATLRAVGESVLCGTP